MHRWILVALVLLVAAPMRAAITDLSTWSVIEDPADPGMSASIDLMGAANLVATGAISSGTDIGYASVNGADVAGSTAGYYFDPSADFSIAVDFNQTAASSIGGSAIGFGIGEDIGGVNSAGVVLGIANGAAALVATGARVNDVDQPAANLVPGFSQGRFFVSYVAASGNVTLGVNPTQGTPAPSVMTTITAIQDQWNDLPLVVSFFLRSQAVNPLPGLTSGSVTAVFSNFEVLSGAPITIVPEPSAALLATVAFLASWRLRPAR